MKLSTVLANIPHTLVQGNNEEEVLNLEIDSRKVSEGGLFTAIVGAEMDGHSFIDKAISQGAKVIVLENVPENLQDGVSYVKVKNTSDVLGILASNFYVHPSKQLKIVAVTGTNGKTTIATLLQKLFMELGHNVGLLSTIENKINDEIIPTKLTTPDAITINKLMAEMVQKNCTHCFMEASSHAIVQGRLGGLDLDGAVFTNISHDHLDYHGTFKDYINAKKKLFDDLPKHAFALINQDDRRGEYMLQNTKASKKSFALKAMATFKAKLIENSFEGLHLEINNQEVWCRLIGDFNAYNLLAIYGVAVLLEEDEQEVLQLISSLDTAAGRFEQLISQKEQIRGIVDYAHTPDALENVLKTINNIRDESERIITIVGCGGNRDKEKRPIMASKAVELSDLVILTSDNPRNEEPELILQDMQKGVEMGAASKVRTIVDRKEAIEKACEMAYPKDIILVAGKGHETYQEVKGIRSHFDDKEVLLSLFRDR
ncbi:UDP-N-acetylmuramoyl-L-alanyl-D-glutamate--2,6-diaminopimelate ligase [Sediminitomix flava]|uniref:UDP-N-acetylmuramoyl-L-alanyl-D-glutamate--2,6-diaminopimelate ligase n=1 Tax=Sediminitomix flava TaxID=379075 RepID=A0A315Z930_SEDFL|nr:UDP-N-acetylmuramoyl-L-alanyl-D-glutamate--2,6-diaminopimelate ligase [Sediminitomix flava]PWJ42065.1 UDP-N-acetylmuramoylalanyl-D-glutamate--2,6-diaminopimelate ligase [Sediminitomix flava]